MIPPSLDILGFRFSIIEEDLPLLDKQEVCGMYDFLEQKITIRKGMSEARKLTTLVHEVIEVIDAVLDLGLKHDAQLCKLEAGIFQVLSTNGLLKGLLPD